MIKDAAAGSEGRSDVTPTIKRRAGLEAQTRSQTSEMCPQDRRLKCLAIIALVVVVVALSVWLGVIYGKTFKQRFIEKCEGSKTLPEITASPQ